MCICIYLYAYICISLYLYSIYTHLPYAAASPCVLNRYSRIPVAQPHKYELRFPLGNPIYDMDTYIFKVNVFTKQDEHE